MNRKHFLKQRQADWSRFETLVKRISRSGKKRLRPEELAEFSRLFRELSNDLATIRSRAWGQHIVNYLNDLVSRGHNGYYSAPPTSIPQQMVKFFTSGFPRLLRANMRYFVVAWLLFFVPLGITWTAIQVNPSLAYRIIPTKQLEMMDEMYADPSDDEEEENESSESVEESLNSGFAEERSLMAGFYIRHNTGIALRSFILGVTFGVGTVYILLYNGVAIGAIAGFVIASGHSERFLTFVVSHGSFELTAIAIAGAGGLMLGDSLIHRGQRSLVDSLSTKALDAIKIMGGAAVMLFIAALIEAYWSPSGIPTTIKVTVGAILWVLVYTYLFMAGRGSEDNDYSDGAD